MANLQFFLFILNGHAVSVEVSKSEPFQVFGGPVLFGFISAVAFSTILAVVSGLTIAGASAVSHDLYARLSKANG
ncbi:MAG TPA: hypothetical protein VE860_18610 [Chthoniobacterales bacterium]|jgi:Na+(H+)/acetate symporter ActP|nr:hypothetical protein [Chthoniobacterales bacterium]